MTMPTGGDVGAFGLGAVDEALFGLPEWALKQMDREAVESYIKKHEKAYRTGEAVGTVGSMFIPIPGLGAAKLGAGAVKAAKAAKAIDLATDAARLAKGGESLGRLALKGAAAGALESGVRGVTSEKTPEQIASDIATGGMFGAGGGALGGIVSRKLPRLAGEATKGAEKAYLGTTELGRRQALSYLKDVAGPGAKGMGKLRVADDARKELVRVGKEIGAHIPGKMDEAILNNANSWQKIDDAVEAVAPNIRGSELLTKAESKLDIPALKAEFGDELVDGYLADLKKRAVNTSGLANSRELLADEIRASYAPVKSGADAGAQRMNRKIANDLRSGVDEFAMDAAKEAGLDIDIRKLKRDYLPMRALAESGAIQDIVPNRVNLGSPTLEKLAMSGIGSAAGATQGDDWQERVRNAAIGGLGGSLVSKSLARGATAALSKGIPLAQAAETAIGKAAPEAIERMGAQVGGEAAAVIANRAKATVPTETKGEDSAADAGAQAGSGNQPAYLGKVMERIQNYATAQGVPLDSQEYKDFLGQVYAATNGFSPDSVGDIIYTDPDERKAYKQALAVSARLKDAMPGALSAKPGFMQGETDEARISREVAIDKLASTVGDVAKERGSEAAAKKSITKILASGETPDRKEQLIKTLLSGYGVDLDELQQLGVI